MRLPSQTIRGDFALFALGLALPLVGLIGYGLYDRARDAFRAPTRPARLSSDVRYACWMHCRRMQALFVLR